MVLDKRPRTNVFDFNFVLTKTNFDNDDHFDFDFTMNLFRFSFFLLTLTIFIVKIFASKHNENLSDPTKRFTHALINGEVRGDGNLPIDDRNISLIVELRLTRDDRPRPIARTRINLNNKTKPKTKTNDRFEIRFRLKYSLEKISPFNTYVLSARIRDGKNRLIYIGDLPLPVTEDREKRAKSLVVKMIKTPSWFKNIDKLSPLAYKVTQLAGTEEAFTSDFYTNKRSGLYTCVVCNSTLFSSKHKYSSGTGWPSFYQTIDETSVATNVDRKYGLTRTEVHCAECKAHLGHVFDDGPRPTYLRYCINGVALEFYPDGQDKEH